MLMLVFSVFFSMLSVTMMSYLAINASLGPWMAPVFVVVVMVLVIPFVQVKWFYEHALMAIVAGSLGGIIGIALGYWMPIFYLLRVDVLTHPFMFFILLFSSVMIAGCYGLLIAHVLRYFFIKSHRFAISQLVYDVIFVDKEKKAHDAMLYGIGLIGAYNVFLRVAAVFGARQYLGIFEMIPLFSSIGFVAGYFIVFPMLVGLLFRLMIKSVLWLHGTATHEHACLITFSLGLLIVALMHFMYTEVLDRNFLVSMQKMYQKLRSMHCYTYIMYSFLFFVGVAVLHWLYVPWHLIVYSLIIVAWLSKYIVRVLADVGVVEFDSYVWFVLIPMMYMFHISTLYVAVIALFATVTFGVVVDSLFIYKLIDLAGISYNKTLRYQCVALISSGLMAVFVFWKFGNSWIDGAINLENARLNNLNEIMQLGQQDYYFLWLGVLLGILLLLFTKELVLIVGACLMQPVMTSILVFAALYSSVIKNRTRLYPFLFGAYAGQMGYLILMSLIK